MSESLVTVNCRPIAVLRPKQYVIIEDIEIDFKITIYSLGERFMLSSKVTSKEEESDIFVESYDTLEELQVALEVAMDVFEPFERDVFFFPEKVTDEDYHSFSLWDLKLND